MTRAEIIQRAMARANADARAALDAAHVAAPLVPEYSEQSDATGKRLLVPTGAIARGMATYLDGAFQRAHPDQLPRAPQPQEHTMTTTEPDLAVYCDECGQPIFDLTAAHHSHRDGCPLVVEGVMTTSPCTCPADTVAHDDCCLICRLLTADPGTTPVVSFGEGAPGRTLAEANDADRAAGTHYSQTAEQADVVNATGA